MLIGYARTSTLEQRAGLEAQRESLRANGCDRLYEEQVSSVAIREALRDALSFCREGDTLVVTKLDRLARSVKHLGEIIEELEGKKVGLLVLDLGLDTSNATGKLMLNVLGAVAQFERELMIERQREGIAKAKAEGRYKGRKPTAQMKSLDIMLLSGQGLSKRAIAQRLELSERSVFRVLSTARQSLVEQQNLQS
ncbi:recombinase family protein [Ruegeria sp. 2205SS24-7]|uniref:recombinase family protein n=1 Tax=Ruegeria discodermiae TaxID=3064389 RepID=UPI0027405373|nr:recombinase family protein [Ruegeria sp. 2205SS24-7]MDP5220042.1 recombinase family protein [Ruegeria sp. 2205SS24-7]